MSDLELDLESGDPELAEKIAAAGSARSARVRAESGASAPRKKAPTARAKAAAAKVEDNLTDRLEHAFDRIAEQLEAREDFELATVIREDREAMTRGIVSLTRSVKFLRNPLVVVLSFLEPVLAFWRIGGVLGRRFVERRQRAMMERDAAMQEHEAAKNGVGVA